MLILRLFRAVFAPKYPRYYTGRHRIPRQRGIGERLAEERAY
jgi:hypothetical protein